MAIRSQSGALKRSRANSRNREQRLARYQELRNLLGGGMNRSGAARHLGLPLCTVQHWLAYGFFPERKQRVYPSIVDVYGTYLEKRYGEGCREINQLWHEVRKMGFEGRASSLRHWLRQRFGSIKERKDTSTREASHPALTYARRMADAEGRSSQASLLEEAVPTPSRLGVNTGNITATSNSLTGSTGLTVVSALGIGCLSPRYRTLMRRSSRHATCVRDGGRRYPRFLHRGASVARPRE